MKNFLSIFALSLLLMAWGCEGGGDDVVSPDDEKTEQPDSGKDDGTDDGKEDEDSDNPLAQLECAPNEILYTTKYDLPIELGSTQGFGSNLVYNTYENGVGRLTFDNDVVYIPHKAFKDCNSMKHIKYPNSVISIGDYASYACSSLTSITIPNSVTSMGECAFYGCSSLTSITIPDSVTSIGESAFEGCSSLTSISIPDSVTKIGNNAFYNCTGELIINSKIIETDYTSSNYPRYNGWLDGSKFTKLTIGNSVTLIGDYAFYGCSSLKSITIPDSVTSIGNYAFYGCPSLKSVYCEATTPPGGSEDMFYYNADGRKIYVPTGSVDAYKAADYWKEYANYIVGYDF